MINDNIMYDNHFTKMDMIDLLLLPTYNAGMLMIYDKFVEK